MLGEAVAVQGALGASQWRDQAQGALEASFQAPSQWTDQARRKNWRSFRERWFLTQNLRHREIICEQVEVYEEKLENIKEQYKLGMETLENRTRKGI